MHAKQKLNQASLERWALLIKAQEDSGLTIKTWCEQNNVSFYAYNYWKHLLKEDYVDSCMLDIVQVSPEPSDPAPVSEDQLPASFHESSDLSNSRDSRHSYDPQPLRICTPDIDVSFSPSVSDDQILRISTIRGAYHLSGFTGIFKCS